MNSLILYIALCKKLSDKFPDCKQIAEKHLNQTCEYFSTKLYTQWSRTEDRWYYQLILNGRREADEIIRAFESQLKRAGITYKRSIEVDESDRLDVVFDFSENPEISEEEINWDDAIPEFEEAIRANPNDPNNHINLGAAYISKAMWDEAIAEYRLALKINPKHVLAHTGLGVAYLQKGMVDQAISEHRKALAIDPNFGDAHTNLAVGYYSKKRYTLAIKHCDKAIELGCSVHPDFLEALKIHR